MKDTSKLSHLVTTFLLLGPLTVATNAAIVINLSEDGGDIVATSSGGSLNVDDLNLLGNSPSSRGGFNGNGLLRIGGGSFDFYDGASIDFVTFSSASFSTSSADTGGPVGMAAGAGLNGIIYVSQGYTSGETLLPSSSRWASTSLVDLGLSVGSAYTVSWGSGASADSITFQVVPEPSSALLAAFGALGALSSRRRRKH